MSSQSKADEAADECPPSYEESAITPLGRMLSGPGIVSEIEFRRQEVVRSAIENHVLPNLRRQAKYGIAKSATVLEPCQTDMPDQKSNDDTSKEIAAQIVSHEGENLTVVQLEGDMHSTEFWSQPSAMEELRRQLHDILCASTVFEGVEFKGTRVSNPEPEPSKGSKSWGKKLMKEFAMPKDEIALAHPPKNSQGVQLSVAREDVVRRITNDFGLYDNVTKPVIIVRVEVWC